MDGATVQAQIVELTRTLAATRMGAAWWRDLGVSGERRRQEGDHGWQWVKTLGGFRHDKASALFTEAAAVVTDDGQVQGAMIYLLNGVSRMEDAPAVAIERLATAPRNRKHLVKSAMYRDAGTNLVRWAAYRSLALGFGGRVVLESLDAAAAFYRSRGFCETGSSEDDMMIMELTPAKAQALLERDGTFK